MNNLQNKEISTKSYIRDYAIEVDAISHSYSGVQAIKNISFNVAKGELFGLIGPDGAGKTTIFRILTTLIIPDSGTARVDGFSIIEDYKEIRKGVGYMPGRFSLYQDLSVEENLKLFATLFGTTIKENYHLIKDIYTQIEPFKKRKAGKLSGGMKQKLALCCALIHKPTVLFLDEPTTGVDPVSRKEFWEMLKRLKEQGITILVSTSYMDEAVLCDRMAFIKGGEILQIETPANIIKTFPKKLLSVKVANMKKLKDTIQGYKSIVNFYSFGEAYHLTLEDGVLIEDFIESLTKFLGDKGFTSILVEEIKPTVEDCFIEKINQDND